MTFFARTAWCGPWPACTGELFSAASFANAGSA